MEEETLCYTIPSYSFPSIGGMNLLWSMYTHSRLTWLVTLYVMVLERKHGVDWSCLHYWFEIDKLSIDTWLTLQNTLPVQNLWLMWTHQSSSGYLSYLTITHSCTHIHQWLPVNGNNVVITCTCLFMLYWKHAEWGYCSHESLVTTLH